LKKSSLLYFFNTVDEHGEASAVNKRQKILLPDTGGAVFRAGNFKEVIRR